jgi:hypothetical protein
MVPVFGVASGDQLTRRRDQRQICRRQGLIHLANFKWSIIQP